MLGTESARMTEVLKYLTLLQERQTLIEAGMIQYLCETEGRTLAQGNVEALWEKWWLCQGWGKIHRQGDIEMDLEVLGWREGEEVTGWAGEFDQQNSGVSQSLLHIRSSTRGGGAGAGPRRVEPAHRGFWVHSLEFGLYPRDRIISLYIHRLYYMLIYYYMTYNMYIHRYNYVRVYTITSIH